MSRLLTIVRENLPGLLLSFVAASYLVRVLVDLQAETIHIDRLVTDVVIVIVFAGGAALGIQAATRLRHGRLVDSIIASARREYEGQ